MAEHAGWKVAIIGAGICGASAGQVLASKGALVTHFDKGRGPGGRCATRRRDALRFDHGAQYFTARHVRFKYQVAAWATAGAAERWKPRIGDLKAGIFSPTRGDDLWVGTPGMNDLARKMLCDQQVFFDARVEVIERVDDRWAVVNATGEPHTGFDQLLVTVPAPQAPPLLRNHFPLASEAAANATMLPCWSLMLAFNRKVDLPFDAAKVSGDGPVCWLARNSSKPGRPDNAMDCWVVHADHAWSQDCAELTPLQASEVLLNDFKRICEQCSASMSEPVHHIAHLWRFALAKPDTAIPCMIDAETGLAVAGDWMSGGRIEHAWLSGLAAAEALATARSEDTPAGTGP